MATERQLASWTRAYQRGESYRRIAARARRDESTVRRALKGRVTPRRPGPKRATKPTTQEVVDTFLTLGSIRATYAYLGVAKNYVYSRLFEAGYVERHPDRRRRTTTRLREPTYVAQVLDA